MATLRIDTAIKPASNLRLLLYSALISILIVLAWSAGLALEHYVLILIATSLIVSYLAISRPILLHLSQPPLTSSFKKDWQLLMRSSRGDALWQAELIAVHRYQLLLHLQFQIVEPRYKRCSVTVYRDQMSPMQWQQLNILATAAHMPT